MHPQIFCPVKRLLLMLAITAGSAFAQTAQVTGRVTDATGAVVPTVPVKVTNVATLVERTTVTNDSGYYTVPLLQPGNYLITVEQPGFKTITRSGVVLEVDQRAEINFVLEVGTVTERVEVRADALQLNTVEASQGQVIENRRIVDLPLNGRDYNDLALLTAGTAPPPGGSRYGGFSSGGMRVTQNNFLLDGADNNGVELAGAQRQGEMVKPSIDAIQEFKVQTNSYAAEYGRAMGSVVNVNTKSGTNDLHGTAFEFLRNEKLDAKNFFDPPDRPKPPFKRNQYGFSVGGPLVIPKLIDGRNRFFWFGDYEGTRIRESSTTNSTIPTLRMRNGDFGELLTQLNRTIRDPQTNQPFPGNVIPQTRLDPLARTLIDLYPQPQNSSVAVNYLYQAPARQDVDKWDVRTDAVLSSRDSMFWRLSKQDLNSPGVPPLPPPVYGANAFDFITEGINTGANWSRTWSPTMVMSVRGAWNFGLFKRDNPAGTNGELLNQKYGIRGGNSTIPGGFSALALTGYRQIGLGGFNPVDRDSQNRQIAGDLTWIKGAHTIKIGASLLASQNNIFNIRNEIGNYTFNGRFTGDGAADFLLGMASGYAWNTRIQVDLRSKHQSYFFQDDWKVTPNLTVNLGLRYELVLPFIDKQDRMGIFDTWTNPADPRLIYADDEPRREGRALTGTDTNNFMPRVGFAYKLNNKTVIRSGYGIFYGYLEPYGDAEFLIGNPPNAFGVDLTSSATVPALILRDGPPPGALELSRATGLTFVSYQREGDIGYSQQWNFNIQRESGRDWLLEVGYSGSRGVHLLRRYEDNFSPPGPGNINAKRPYQRAEIPGTGIVTSPLGPIYGYKNDGNSTYHALLTKVEKRFSAGLTLLGSYTFSKNLSDLCGHAAAGNVSGCGYQDTRFMQLEKGLDNQDIPHRFIVSGVYELPFGRGRTFGGAMNRAVDAIAGGWAIGSIVVWESGRPYSVTVQGNAANTGTREIVNRPNLVGDPKAGERTLDRDFNTAAFAPNAQYQIGNVGRNTMRERSEFNWDFSAMKDFRLAERLRLQFRFEAFHFTNTPRFGTPGAVVGTNAFGVISGAGTPRNLQFGMKLVW